MAHLHVRLERDEYHAGGTVRGTLILENSNPILLAEQSEATVMLLGIEKTAWIFRRKKPVGDDDFIWEKTECGGKATFLKTVVTISFVPPANPGSSRANEGVLQPGTHEFPFSFDLPSTCPPSMIAAPPDFVTAAQTSYTDIRAEISYRVQPTGRTFTCARSFFRVVEEPKRASGTPLVRREVLDMETVRCGCFRATSGGCLDVTLRVDKDSMVAGDVLQPGDITPVIIEVHNRTWNTFRLGYLTLRQRLLLGDPRANSGVCERNLRRVKLPTVPSRARLTGDKAIRVQLRAPDNIDPLISDDMCNSLITNSYSLQLLFIDEGCGGAAFVELIQPYDVRPRPLNLKAAPAKSNGAAAAADKSSYGLAEE